MEIRPRKGRFRFSSIVSALALVPFLACAELTSQVGLAGDNPAVISAPDAYLAAVRGQTLLIDVRESYEIKGGAPAGTLARISYRLDRSRDHAFVAEITGVAAGEKWTNLTLFCATGVRSAAARELLLMNGFTSVKSLAGGFEAWRDSSLPEIEGRST